MEKINFNILKVKIKHFPGFYKSKYNFSCHMYPLVCYDFSWHVFQRLNYLDLKQQEISLRKHVRCESNIFFLLSCLQLDFGQTTLE